MTPLIGPEKSSGEQPAALLARFACLRGGEAALLIDGVVRVATEFALDLSQASLAPGPCAMRQQLEDEVITSTNAEL